MVFGIFVDPSVESVQPSYFFLNIFNILNESSETKLSVAQITKKQASFLVPDGKWWTYWAVGQTPGYCGVATFCKAEQPLSVYTDADLFAEEDEAQHCISKEGRLVVTDHGDFVLFNVYCPNAGGKGRPRIEFKARFLEALWRKMEEFRVSRGRRVILAGDLNLVADMKADMHEEFWSADGVDERTRHWLPRLLCEGTYVDSFRSLHPDRKDAYTFFDNYVTTRRGLNQGYRIDYILVSSAPSTGPRLLAAEILTNVLRTSKASDHVPVMVELELEHEKLGKEGSRNKVNNASDRKEGAGQRVEPLPEQKAVLAAFSPLPPSVKDAIEGRTIFRKILPDPKQPSIKGFFASTRTPSVVSNTKGQSAGSVESSSGPEGAASKASLFPAATVTEKLCTCEAECDSKRLAKNENVKEAMSIASNKKRQPLKSDKGQLSKYLKFSPDL